MAKTKSNSPKNRRASGGKKAASNPKITLRRSPRKATHPGQCTESEPVDAPSRVVKRASPATTSAPEKVTSSTKKTEKASTPEAADNICPGHEILESQCCKSTTTATPKRGRPRKEPSAGVKAAKALKTVRKTKSVCRADDEDLACKIPTASAPVEGWTDSPTKKRLKNSPSKTLRDGPASAKRSPKIYDDACDGRARQASLGGIRKSIEISAPAENTRSRSRSTSPICAGFQSPARSPDPVAKTFAAARTPSIRSNRGPSKDRSRSPAKAAARTPSIGVSCSPTRAGSKQSTRARSKSPAKSTGAICTAGTDVPAPRLTKKRKSELEELRQTATELRGRPERSEFKGGMVASPSPSLGHSGNYLRISKTRPSRSPAKSPPRSHIRSHQASPVKFSTEQEAREHARRQATSPARVLSKESTNAVHAPSRHSSGELAFVNRLIRKDEYGRALRRVESQAYRSTKKGEEISAQDLGVCMEDGWRAQKRGIQRAELEMGFNSIAGNKAQQSVDMTGRLTSAKRLHSGQDRPFVAKRPISPPVSLDENENVEPKSLPPRKKLPKTTLLEAGQADIVNGGNQPLRQGEPSAPNRGAIRSVTNPEFIPGTKKKNPFFETMPAPEVWHRQMPRYFPFGETPFMRRVMSREISEDLARGQEQKNSERNANANLFGRATTAIRSGLNVVGQSIWGGSASKESPSSPPWKLPDVTDSDVEEALRDMQGMPRNTMHVTTGQKRKRSGVNGPIKRVRRRSSGYHMSGAL